MNIRTERDTEIRTDRSEVYEPPMLDEIGEFTTLTCADSAGSVVDGTGYYSE
ncbi:MAG: lasso RiPP family leader peptide-containing protein [Pseudonocardiaceae bacterium]